MWRSSEIVGCSIRATDGPIGSISDLLFDEAHWALRWAVVDTGTWLPGRQVLLPPSVFGRPDARTREFPVDLSRERIEGAPSLEADAPVSRQLETEIYRYHSWNPYWRGGYGYPVAAPVPGGMAGAPIPPTGVGHRGAASRGQEPASEEPEGDPHLRSVVEVTEYYVEASDGNIGHIEDFLVDEEDWVMRYLIVDTKNWWPGKMVLISPQWLRDIRWSEKRVFVEVSRDQVKDSPEYDPSTTPDRPYEERLYGHYGYSTYWGGGI